MRRIKYINFLSIFLLTGILIFPFLVNAQIPSPKYGLILSPLIQEFKAKPGDTIKGSFKITHDFQDINRLVTIYPVARDFTSDGITGNPSWIYYNSKDEVKVDSSLENWITITDSEVKLEKQGVSRDITYTINVPLNATGGTKEAGIIFSESNGLSTLTDNSQVGINSEVAGLVFVEIEGVRSIDLSVIDMSLTDIDGNTPFINIFEYLPVNINLTIKNDGNSISEPQGDIFISPSGKTETTPTIKFNELGGRILPKSTRILSETWNDGFWTISQNNITNPNFTDNIFNKYNLEFNFGKNFKIGSYDVVAKVIYFDTNGDAVLRIKTNSLIIFPWKIALGLIFIVLLLNLRKILKRFKRKQKVEENVTSP